MRQLGKSWLQEKLIEEALDRGEVVAIYSHGGLTIKKRRKHLTVIEFRRFEREATPELQFDQPL